MTDTEHDITAPERDIVLRLLEPFGEDAAVHRAQLAGARTRSSCDCGCPSFQIRLSATAQSTGPQSERTGDPLTTGDAETADGHAIGLILWQSAGRLCGVELYPDEDIGPFGLPDLLSISASEPTRRSSAESP